MIRFECSCGEKLNQNTDWSPLQIATTGTGNTWRTYQAICKGCKCIYTVYRDCVDAQMELEEVKKDISRLEEVLNKIQKGIEEPLKVKEDK